MLGDIPGPARAAVELLGLKLLARINGAPHGSPALERAWRVWHLPRRVVFRLQLKCDRGYGNASARLHALRERIRRPANNCEWSLLREEMLQAISAQTAWYKARAARRSAVAAYTERERRLRRAIRLAQKAQYDRAAFTLAQSPNSSPNFPGDTDKMQALHPEPPAPVEAIIPIRSTAGAHSVTDPGP